MLRLDELEVSGSTCDLRLSEGGRRASAVGERDMGLAEGGDRGEWNIEMDMTRLEGERMMPSERDVEGQP